MSEPVEWKVWIDKEAWDRLMLACSETGDAAVVCAARAAESAASSVMQLTEGTLELGLVRDALLPGLDGDEDVELLARVISDWVAKPPPGRGAALQALRRLAARAAA